MNLVRICSFVAALSLIITSCQQKSTNKRVVDNTTITTTTNNNNNNNNSGGEESGSGGPGVGFTPYQPCVADAGQTIDCYAIDGIKIHGAQDGVVVWSSETDLPSSIPESIFFTNARFNLELVPRYRNGGVDSKGQTCAYSVPQPFQKLQVGVVVRKKGSNFGDYYVFNDVPVDKASYVHEFTVPPNTTDPLVVEILDVKWDWSCIDYCNQGFCNQPGYCPWDNVWSTECVGLDIRVSTDFTKDLPGPRQ